MSRSLPLLCSLAVLLLWAGGRPSVARAQNEQPSEEAAQAEENSTQSAEDEEPSPAEAAPDLGIADPPLGMSLRRRLMVIDAAAFQIDPVVGQVTTERIREEGQGMGYEVLSREETVAAAQRLRMPYPPTPADLWRACWIAQSHRCVFARVWAHAGAYEIELGVASLDGGGPYFARGSAGSEDFREVVGRLLREALPLPSVWDEEGAAQHMPRAGHPGETAQRQRPVVRVEAGSGLDEEFGDEAEAMRREAPEEEEEGDLRRWSLTLQTEAVFGTTSEFFYNHLLGLRLDFRITRDILIGAYVAWSNLEGRNNRVDNLLMMLTFEDRIRVSPSLDLSIPLRISAGYLPFNGPVIRAAAGLNYALSEQWEIGADLIAPSFWVLPDRVAVALDLAVEVTCRF